MQNTTDDIPVGLTIKPYAVQTYTKTSSDKRLVTLHYRREVRGLSRAADFSDAVLADLDRVGRSPRGHMTITLSPQSKTAFRCILEVPLESL